MDDFRKGIKVMKYIISLIKNNERILNFQEQRKFAPVENDCRINLFNFAR